jgi:urease accessory protein
MMLTIREKIDDDDRTAAESLTLSFAERRRSRLRARLDGGEECALVLPRATVLREGDRLRAEDGRVVAVRAAREEVSRASGGDRRLLARAAYHLGNRHVPVEVGDGWLRYAHDHVLDAMVAQLGLEVIAESAPFEPEGGAYGEGGAHAHAHSHGDSGAHGHDD